MIRSSGAQAGFSISSASLTIDGFPQLSFPSSPGAYYILYRSARADNGYIPARMSLSSGALTTFIDGAARGQTVFYQIREVPLITPLDLDQDGIDDAYELNRSDFLNPLYISDASEDFDGDGVSNLLEYQQGTDPAAGIFHAYTTFISSPDNGETGVSVNRETVLLFDRPLDSSVTLTTNQFFTTVSGRRILSRIELASDRRTATLFYAEPLPAGSRVKVTFDGNVVLDNTGHVIDADHNGTPGGVAVVEFDTASITPIPSTAVIGQVFASELTPGSDTGTNAVNTPLADVWITVDGAEQDLRTQTAADGSFILAPAPAGEFFVHIDGREAAGSNFPNGDYYPRVGKKWTALPGVATNLAGGDGKIYLPLVRAGTLQSVSPVADTTISFPPAVIQANPALDGVRITVPANSLFSETGVRNGLVGIAPVPPDRLPSALPDRLNFPLVITVQTDGGENFDRPVPVQFPNLPDPRTGEILPAGAKTALWSFNHDMGNWEVVGAMTISADGRFAITDPGVGIRAPGWHGTDPGSSGGCDKPRGPGDDDDGDDDDEEEEDEEEEGEEEDDDVPPGGDEPDGPGSGSSSTTPSGGGSDDCEAGDCGCDLTGLFVKAEESE
ncbi:MAG: Ig-like domain-containing protein, partial [Limisphaerales bacterium]